MRVLGIDPGPKDVAICVWDGAQILKSWKEPFDRALTLVAMAREVKIDIVAVEILQCFGMGVGKETFDTAYNIGEFRNECKHAKIEFVPVTRKDVKLYFCESVKANDSNINYALQDRFGQKGTKKNPGIMYQLVGSDMRSAFAIAVMVYDQRTQILK